MDNSREYRDLSSKISTQQIKKIEGENLETIKKAYREISVDEKTCSKMIRDYNFLGRNNTFKYATIRLGTFFAISVIGTLLYNYAAKKVFSRPPTFGPGEILWGNVLGAVFSQLFYKAKMDIYSDKIWKILKVAEKQAEFKENGISRDYVEKPTLEDAIKAANI